MKIVTKRREVATLIPNEIYFKFKKFTGDKGYYILIKCLLQQENIKIINIYMPNDRSSKYMKQKRTGLSWKTDSSTIIVGDFNTSLTIMDRTIRQKINKEIEDLNNTLDVTDIYKALYWLTVCTFFSSARGTSSRVDHLMSQIKSQWI